VIVDVFLFNDEFDILECRLRQLDDVVDRFIVIEGNKTLAGDPKPFRLFEKRPDSSKVEIIGAKLDDLGDVPPQQQAWVAKGYEDYWKRDWKQRNAAKHITDALPDDAVVMYGDVDEIPRSEPVRDFDGPKSRLMMRTLIYSTKWWSGHDDWTGTIIGRKREMDSFPLAHRSRNHNPMIPDAGWHMTWFGGEEAVVDKVQMFAHGELAEDIDEVRRKYRERIRPGINAKLVPYDGDLPAWVEEGHAPDSWTEA
jgi:hypothetical protein